MPLANIEVSFEKSVLPGAVERFLCEADDRISKFVRCNPKHETGFVPSNYVSVYFALRAIYHADLSSGNSLCEWGSGFGVVSSLASILGFTACGIEIENTLVDASRALADDFALPVEFIHGSFVPPGAEAHAEEAHADNNGEYPWLIKDADSAYSKPGLQPDSFDVFFSYPWPGEEYLIERLFEDSAANGALLLMHSDVDSISIRRKLAHTDKRLDSSSFDSVLANSPYSYR